MESQDKLRCRFHITPPKGWLNDPNGLCKLKGVYHTFFQYSPDYPHDKNKSWGHYVSCDLVNWNFVGVALEPDSMWDKEGVFSGSAIVEYESMTLFYTGNVMSEGESNTIRVISEDGIKIGEKVCVMDNDDYPEGYTVHIRDPKVWKEGDTFCMVLGARSNDDKGNALFFNSSDGIYWKFFQAITTENKFGYMWECPDVFAINNRAFLSCCPQGVSPEEFRFQNKHLAGYFPMEEGFVDIIDESGFREWDFGFDFYAPQTFLDDTGRRILIAWAGGPEIEQYDVPTLEKEKWMNMLTLPREITEKDDILYQYPVSEISNLRCNKREISKGQWNEVIGNCFDWEIKISDKGASGIIINITRDIKLSYKEKVLALEFTGNIGGGRTSRRVICEEINDIRIVVDKSIIEIFINKGEISMTSQFYPEEEKMVVMASAQIKENSMWDLFE